MDKSTLKLSQIPQNICANFDLPISKSISNRLLILDFLHKTKRPQSAYSSSNDSQILQACLENFESKKTLFVADCGTAARFLVALCAVFDQKSRKVSGSDRMHQRPMKPLFEAVESLGAEVDYMEEKHCLPAVIQGSEKLPSQLTLDASLSSQFLTAILLCASKIPLPFFIHLSAKPASLPYVLLTQKILKPFGFSSEFHGLDIEVSASERRSIEGSLFSEGDWSAAIYPILIQALIPESQLYCNNLFPDSWQGDRYIDKVLGQIGLELKFTESGLCASRIKEFCWPEKLSLDLSDHPDLAQPIICYLAILGQEAYVAGLHTLVYKETNRLAAMKNELEKLPFSVEITASSLCLKPTLQKETQDSISLKTYTDHRMAMSFALLQLRYKQVRIENPEVVKKSFPDFWNQMAKIGFQYKSENAS